MSEPLEDDYSFETGVDANSESFRVCDECFVWILERTNGQINLGSLTASELPVVLIWHLCGLISSLGIGDCLDDDIPGDSNYRITLEQLNFLGLIEVSRLLEEAKGLVRSRSGGKRRWRKDKRSVDKLDKIEEQLQVLQSDIIEKLFHYIRENGLVSDIS